MIDEKLIEAVRRTFFDEMERWRVVEQENRDLVCRFDDLDGGVIKVVATVATGDGEMNMVDMQAKAAASAVIPIVLEAVAKVADNMVATGLMTGLQRDYCHAHGDAIAQSIRSLGEGM